MTFMGRIDGESVRVSPSSSEVDHAASARENLKAAGEELKAAFTPNLTKGAIELIAGDGSSSLLAASVGMMFGVLSLPWAVVGDVLEVGFMPVMAAKDVADAAVHGVAAGLERIRN